VHKQCEIPHELLVKIEARIDALNKTIAGDVNLGPQFLVGHSFVTPARRETVEDGVAWFTHIVNTEIGPLLDEYWFEALDNAQQARKRLLEGF
jgi:5-methylcytosine-specific restriction enzyme B